MLVDVQLVKPGLEALLWDLEFVEPVAKVSLQGVTAGVCLAMIDEKVLVILDLVGAQHIVDLGQRAERNLIEGLNLSVGEVGVGDMAVLHRE